MYQKIKNGLLSPRQLATSYKEKLLGFFFFMILLTSLPFALKVIVNGVLDASNIRNIQNAFSEVDTIDYEIVDHKLIKKNINTQPIVISLEDRSFEIVFLVDETDVTVSQNMLIAMHEDGIYLTLVKPSLTEIKISDYSTWTDLDFSRANNVNDFAFWSIMIDNINGIINQNKIAIYTGYIFAIVIEMIVMILIGILFSTVLLMIFERSPGVRFQEVFKNTLSAYLPYVISLIFTYAFGLSIFQYIGSLISFIYALIANTEYRRIKYKENQII